MPVGPWTSPDFDPDFSSGSSWAPGDVLEFVCRDDDGADQGKGLMSEKMEKRALWTEPVSL